MVLPSDNWALSTAILEAGRHSLGQEASPETTSSPTADALAEVLIDAGARELQRRDMRAHGNRLPADSMGSKAQSVLERLGQDPEPRVAQLIRGRVRTEWQLAREALPPHHHLCQLAAQVVEYGLESIDWHAVQEPEVVAQQLLEIAARAMLQEEGNTHERGGDPEEVQSAADTFDPPIRRRTLAELVIARVRRLAQEARGGSSPLVPPVKAGTPGL